MRNVILIGFMGSGKSTIGKILAQRLEVNWMDMDIEIEKGEGTSIQEIFELKGEEYFRQLETEYLKNLLNKESSIISTGGGIVLREENRILLKEIGTVVFLHTDSTQIIQNLKDDTKRPLLKGDNVEEKIVKLLDERESSYLNAANIIIQTTGKSIDNVVDEIISLL
ncbi:MAG: shikimate kinase [Firmicutes bacterium HGW-Firmicutes-1]|jgi:shikimate kinase|nr:MAG: shikimate kinase [Firmicutes bacterium HGW-Firmicutes-1]